MDPNLDPATLRAVLPLAAARLRATRRPRHLTSQEFAARYRRFPLPIPEIHVPWYQALDAAAAGSGPRRLLLLAPREHAKTSVVLTFAVKRIADDRDVRIGIVSGTETLAQAFLRDVAHELETNRQLIGDHGRFKAAVPLKWDQHELVVGGSHQARDVTAFAAGAGSQVTGRHVDLLILDDVETRDTVQTPERRARTREWFSKELTPTVSPGGIVVIVGTRKHHDDLYNTLMPHEGRPTGWTVLDNALAAFGADGEPIWPEMWSREALLARKAELDAVDVLAWPQEYENRPLPSDTQMFSPLDWPEWQTLTDDVTHYQAWDLAISLKETADFTCGVDIAVDAHQNVYVVDCRYGRWGFDRQQREFSSFGHAYPASMIGIEAVQYQSAAVQEAARRSMLPVIALTLSAKKQRGRSTLARDKVSRARLLEARAKSGKVFRPAGHPPWWGWLAEQLAYFPAGAHDDGVDALAYAVSMAQQRSQDWDYAYNIYRCGCGHGFIMNATNDRPCPRCGAAPVFPSTTEMVIGDEDEVASKG